MSTKGKIGLPLLIWILIGLFTENLIKMFAGQMRD